jgi:hypothetical protein
MGWLWVWLQDRQERRAEAAVRRQLAAVDTFRQVTDLDVDDFDDGPAPWRPPQMASLAGDYGHELAADGRRMPPRHLDPRIIGNAEGNTRQRDRDREAAHRLLLDECRRADALAGKRGGFVTTARIRQLLGGGS